jgi:putative SOS response-associated peptidase YedK
VILSPADYDQWLDKECDPADLIRPFSANGMVTWPISTRVNKSENDDAAIFDRVAI